MSTYTEAHKKYFQKHKDVIRERRREYIKEYNRKYYEDHKAVMDAKKLLADKRKRRKDMVDSIMNQIDPSSPEAATIPIVKPNRNFSGKSKGYKKV